MSQPNGQITVLNPTAPPRQLRTDMAPRPDDLRGKAVGFLWNSKPNGDVLFQRSGATAAGEVRGSRCPLSPETHRIHPGGSPGR